MTGRPNHHGRPNAHGLVWASDGADVRGVRSARPRVDASSRHGPLHTAEDPPVGSAEAGRGGRAGSDRRLGRTRAPTEWMPSRAATPRPGWLPTFRRWSRVVAPRWSRAPVWCGDAGATADTPPPAEVTTAGCALGSPTASTQRSTRAALLSDQRTTLPIGPMLGLPCITTTRAGIPRSPQWWRRPRRGRMRGAFLRRGRLTPDGSGECREGRCDAGHTRSRPGRHGTLAPTAGRGCRRATTPPTFGSTTVEHGRSRARNRPRRAACGIGGPGDRQRRFGSTAEASFSIWMMFPPPAPKPGREPPRSGTARFTCVILVSRSSAFPPLCVNEWQMIGKVAACCCWVSVTSHVG